MRAFVASALRNRISATGIALTTASGLMVLGLLVLELVGVLANPYTGLVLFIIVPGLFVLGLLLIPLGIWLDRRRGTAAATDAWPSLNLQDPTNRRVLLFVVVATFVNLGIIAMVSVGAVEYTESQAFCGQVCHTVMEPEFTAHQAGPHARVHCVACHVGPGAGGFLTAKLNGTRQLRLVMTGGYSRPIPTPVERMPGVADTCQQCHAPDRYVGDVVKAFYEHGDDAANTETKTLVRLNVGGPLAGNGTGAGIHWHTNPANVVEYIPGNAARDTIPYVRATTADGTTREYFAEGVDGATMAGKATRRMDCLDCHSRPAHQFGTTPDRAVDEAVGTAAISMNIPFVRREAVRALQVPYPTRDAALSGIDQTMRAALVVSPASAFQEADLRRAIAVTQAIYRRSVFPSMKVAWGTYKRQNGHTTSDGCFRCHDDEHKTRDGQAIRQDCEMCHAIE